MGEDAQVAKEGAFFRGESPWRTLTIFGPPGLQRARGPKIVGARWTFLGKPAPSLAGDVERILKTQRGEGVVGSVRSVYEGVCMKECV